jgi:hypothetical protein
MDENKIFFPFAGLRRALRTEPELRGVERLRFIVAYVRGFYFPGTTPAYIKDSVALSVWEYETLRQYAATDFDLAPCKTCHQQSVKAVPVERVHSADGACVGVCENCCLPVVLDTSGNAPLWVWKVKQRGGLQHSVTWIEA